MTTLPPQELLLEIGCEELPASFVEAALAALPTLAERALREARLGHGTIGALGTPRRLALLVHGLDARQADLEEELLGPPARVALKEGKPTKAAEAFAERLGCSVDALRTVSTPKGDYLAGTRREPGRPARELLGASLAAIVRAVPFRKAMRWGNGSFAFGRPLRWLVALLGTEPIRVEVGEVVSGASSTGHRFLHPMPVPISDPGSYLQAMRAAHVLVDPLERAARMRELLDRTASAIGGRPVDDEFLLAENLSLVEEPHVIAGQFDPSFLELPEAVILEVARGHQRYFGVRSPDGRLLPRYLAVVNTAERPEAIALGNDRVMRARLADARFFFREDLAKPLGDRREKLAGVVFQERLGSVLAKSDRGERLCLEVARLCRQPDEVARTAAAGARLAKCDLVTLMVGEFPELQGSVGEAYALRQGIEPAVAAVIREHYQPRGAADVTAPSRAGAIAALAERIDTLVGCFGIGLAPTGAADPFGLRRACIGMLRTLLDHGIELDLREAFAAAAAIYAESGVTWQLSADRLGSKLEAFARDRLRGLLAEAMAGDAVDAALGVAAHRPIDARARAAAILGLDGETRARVGELFKRATHIAKGAPEGEPRPPTELLAEVAPAEQQLHDAFTLLRGTLVDLAGRADYAAAFSALAGFTPVLARYFEQVFVMVDEPALRDNRLRLMRAISESCSRLASLELLGVPATA